MLIPLNKEGLERLRELYCSDSGLNEKDISYIVRHWDRKLGESFEFKHDLFVGWKKFRSSYEALCSLYPFRYVSMVMKEAAAMFSEDRVMCFPANGGDNDLSRLFLRRIRQDYDVISYGEMSNDCVGYRPASLLEATLAANKLPVASPTPGLRKLLDSLSATALSCSRHYDSKEPSSASFSFTEDVKPCNSLSLSGLKPCNSIYIARPPSPP